MEQKEANDRKADHLDMAFDAQAPGHDPRFNYEPMLAAHPFEGAVPPVLMAGRTMRFPLWVSSMTGGAKRAEEINRRLAEVCKEFGLGMGLGSCRPVLKSKEHLPDFAMRSYIGDQPLFANLGIAQVEELVQNGETSKITDLVNMLEADGLIIHINPLQEWLQPEGDRIQYPPIDTIKRLMDKFKLPLMVKEVGQGFGPKSMAELLELPLEAIDFGAQGGTNFSLLETMRQNEFYKEQYEPVAHIGHTATEMTNMVRDMILSEEMNIKTRGIIVSGGIHNFLDGYYHLCRIPYKAIYAQASIFLKYALEGEEALFKFVESQVGGLEMAYNYLTPKEQ